MSASNFTPFAIPNSMSTREIAELTGKQHKNVIRDLRKQFEALGINALKIERVYRDRKNEERTEYVLDEEMTLTLTSGYSVVQRNTIIKQWQAYRKQQADFENHLRWSKTRHGLKSFWHDMNEAIEEAYGNDMHEYAGAREQNMIYKILFGMTAKQIISSRKGNALLPAKDCMTGDELEIVAAMEAANSLMLVAGQDRDTRKAGLKKLAASRRKKLGLPPVEEKSITYNIFASEATINNWEAKS